MFRLWCPFVENSRLPCMQVPTGFEMLSLVILTLGVVLSIWEGSVSGSWLGISVAVASTVCGAAMLSFSGKVRISAVVAELQVACNPAVMLNLCV